MMNLKHRAIGVVMTLLALFFSACSDKATDVKFSRLEHLLFETPAERLSAELTAKGAEFDTPLLNLHPDDPQYMQMLAEFVSDPMVRRIYEATDSIYSDLHDVELQLGKALAKAAQIYPEMRYERLYTLVTADIDDYQNRVFCNENELALSIDHYAVGCFPGAVPAYIERLSKREYIAPDCMAAMARAHIAMPDGDMTLLDYAIAEGKTLYFLEETMPGVDDTLRLRYTGEHLDWMRENTANVWGWLLQQKLLYSKDLSQFHNLIDEAPKTNAFGEGSAPRTPFYIGLQIVRQYMKKSGASMQELFAETDSQKILTTAAWRP